MERRVVDVPPDLMGRPIGDRIDFHQMKFRVPCDLCRGGAKDSLVAANAGNPGVQSGKLLAEGFDLAERAASVRIAMPESGTVAKFLRLGSERGLDAFDGDSVALLDAIHEGVGLGKKESVSSVKRRTGDRRAWQYR